jgi:hypothetical protein
MRALLTESISSPIAWSNLFSYLKKGNFKIVPKNYTVAADNIIREFMKYSDIKSKKDIILLSNEERSIRSLEIFNRTYPK